MTHGEALVWLLITGASIFTFMIWTLIIARTPYDPALVLLAVLITIMITFAIAIPVLA